MIQENTLTSVSEARQFVTFYLNERTYGLDVAQVQEITNATQTTPVPHAPNYISGLINLRGQIAAAVNLKAFLKISTVRSQTEMNIICQIDQVLLAFVVDAVGDVVTYNPGQIEACPANVNESTRNFIRGIYKGSESLISIIDLDKLIHFLSVNEFESPKHQLVG